MSVWTSFDPGLIADVEAGLPCSTFAFDRRCSSRTQVPRGFAGHDRVERLADPIGQRRGRGGLRHAPLDLRRVVLLQVQCSASDVALRWDTEAERSDARPSAAAA